MKPLKTFAAVAAALVMPAFASAHDNSHYAHGHHHHHHAEDGSVISHEPAKKEVVIKVSCFRGPSNDIIWDKPNAVFVDSLVEAGYTFPTAHAIAYRICRDPETVNDPEGMKRAMERIYRDPASRRNMN